MACESIVEAPIRRQDRASGPTGIFGTKESNQRRNIVYLAYSCRRRSRLDERLHVIPELVVTLGPLVCRRDTIRRDLEAVKLLRNVPVATGPGLTQFTVMPCDCPSSLAQTRAKDSLAALVAAYTVWPATPRLAAAEDTKTTRPPRGMCGMIAWVRKIGPLTFVSKCVVYMSSVT